MALSTQQRCILAVQASIQALSLTGLPGGNVLARKLPVDRELDKLLRPTEGETAIVVLCSLPMDAGETMEGGFNQRENIGYPVQVTLLTPENQAFELDDASDAVLLIRQVLILHFHNLRLTGVSEVFTCRVEPRAILDPDTFLDKNLFASGFLVRCTARQSRD